MTPSQHPNTPEQEVIVRRGVPHTTAECEDCRQQWDGSGTSKADNARSAAKRHAATTGHTVYIERCLGTYLNPKR